MQSLGFSFFREAPATHPSLGLTKFIGLAKRPVSFIFHRLRCSTPPVHWRVAASKSVKKKRHPVYGESGKLSEPQAWVGGGGLKEKQEGFLFVAISFRAAFDT